MKTYRNHEGETVEITPVRPSAFLLLHAFLKLQEAMEAHDKAVAAVPAYTAQHEPIDYYGEELNDLHRATEAFEDAVVASVKAAEER